MDYWQQERENVKLLEAVAKILREELMSAYVNWNVDAYIALSLPQKHPRWKGCRNRFEIKLEDGDLIIRPQYLRNWSECVVELADPDFCKKLLAYARNVPDWDGLP